MYWKAFESNRAKWYGGVKREVAKVFTKEHKAVIKGFKANGLQGALNAVDKNKPHMLALYTDIYVDVMDDFGNKTLKTLRKDINNDMELKLFPSIFRVFDKFVQQFIATTVAQKVVGVTNVTKQKIRDIIAPLEKAGASIEQMRKALDSLYLDQIIPNRSEVIARTEVIGASNAGSSYAADQTGLKLEKEWLSTRDDRTRESHVGMDGEKRPKEKKYSNGLMFPGDPEGEPEEVIQCRCTEVYKRVK